MFEEIGSACRVDGGTDIGVDPQLGCQSDTVAMSIDSIQQHPRPARRVDRCFGSPSPNVAAMRRTAITSSLLIALTIGGCNSGSTTQRTVTVLNTVPSSSAPTSAPRSTGSVVVVSPSASATPPKTTPKTTAPTTPATTAVSAAPFVKLDPLKADCASTLDAADIKKAIGVTVGANTNRIRLGPAGKSSGAIRCLYGSTDAGKSAPVRVRLTQYGTAAAAKKQVEVDVQAAQDSGAAITKTTVNGYPATLQLMAGGVIEMQYDTWTLSVAVSDQLASPASLTSGLPTLAGQAVLRVVKNA